MKLRPPIVDSLTPRQRAVLDFEAHPDEFGDRLSQIACLGWYGSGKTTIAALRLLRHIVANPWTPAYGSTNPATVIIGPSLRVLNRATKAALEMVVPPELIMRRRGTPHNDLLLANGHLIILWSAEAALEGITITGIWADEISHPAFDAANWTNFVSRVRDPLSKSLLIMVSGLPEVGFVADTFRPWCESPKSNQLGALLATADNPIMRGAKLDAIAEATCFEDRDLLTNPTWRASPLAVFPSFDSSVHVVDRHGDTSAPCHVGIDVGNISAVVYAQDCSVSHKSGPTKGLLIVDELIEDSPDLDAVLTVMQSKPYRNISTISVDPTIRPVEYNAIRRHFPQARIYQRERGEDFFDVEEGLSNLRRALMDGLGNVSLLVSRSLANGDKRGVVASLSSYKRLPSGRLPKNGTHEHVADALRYAVSTALPLSDGDRPKAFSRRRAA